VRPLRILALIVALGLAVSACSGDSAANSPVATTASNATAATGGGGSADSDTGDTTGSTAAGAPPEETLFNQIGAAAAAAAGTPASESALGSPDFAAAATIAADLFAEIDSTGLKVLVFPVIGSEEVLLVLEIDGAAIDQDAEATDFDLFAFLATDPSVSDAGITRIAFNLNTSDEQGEVVITTTVSVAAIREAAANDTDIPDDAVVFQVLRNGVVQ